MMEGQAGETHERLQTSSSNQSRRETSYPGKISKPAIIRLLKRDRMVSVRALGQLQSGAKRGGKIVYNWSGMMV